MTNHTDTEHLDWKAEYENLIDVLLSSNRVLKSEFQGDPARALICDFVYAIDGSILTDAIGTSYYD